MQLPSLGMVALATAALANPIPNDDNNINIIEERGFGNFRNDILGAPNWFRKAHGANKLVWNDQAAASTQNWANQCNWKHQSNNHFGENLAAGGFSSWFDVVNMWAHERVNYDWNNPGFSGTTGHFTQLAWKGTTSVGCGWHHCGKGNGGGATGLYVVCEYSPPGNVIGHFRANVGKQVFGHPGDKYWG